MFNKKRKVLAAEIFYFGTVKKGKLFNSDRGEFTLPPIEKIFQHSIKQLSKVGLSAQRVSPAKSNYIFRVYRHKDNACGFYGVEVLKKPFMGYSYYTLFHNIDFFSSYSIHINDINLGDNTYFPNFVDYYVKIR